MTAQFPTKHHDEARVVSLNVSGDVPAGAKIQGTPTLAISVETGTESPITLHADTSPQVAGLLISQKLSAGLAGITYRLTYTYNLTNGETVVSEALLPVGKL